MTESEAKKTISLFRDEWDKNSKTANAKALDIAIKAIEKQIPKKPKNKKYSFYPHSTLLKSKYGKCPVCKSIQVDDEYCANCGQKLDWSDEQ